jgi:hypothetical protein
VYGVALPHHDGRAGCAAVVFREAPNSASLRSLAVHTTSALPRFAVPLFLRHVENMVTTGTNKQQKHTLQVEGVDVNKVTDTLYWLKNGEYVRFGEKDWKDITEGKVRL